MWPFSQIARAKTSRHGKRAARPRLAVELLEERAVPSTVPNDALFDRLWGMEAIHAPEAWDLTTGSTQVVVAVNDTGVDYTHPDLYKNIWLNQDEIPREIRRNLTDVDSDGLITFWDLNESVNQGPGKITDLNGTGYIDGGDLLRPAAQGGWADGRDNGNNGFTDDLIGWDFADHDNDPMDVDGHGTHVAGILGAVGNNGVGVVGVNWQVQIMPLRRLAVQDSIDAVYYAANNGARVSNNSYGVPATALTEAERAAAYAAIQYAAARDHLFVAAAHNQGSNNDVAPILPASYDLPNIISVAATTVNDRLAHFSNYGATSVDLGAPGVNIWSTVPDSDYANFFGTSMATPHVAGAAALILARNPNLSYAQVKALILDNVDPLPDLAGKTVTGGRLNIYKAVNATPMPVLASSDGSSANTESLTTEPVGQLVTEALARWQAAGQDLSGIGAIDIRIADLGGTTLGLAAGHTIWLDANAAGWGWFVDPAPWDDSEFTTPGDQSEHGKKDLLTALAHEIGHLVGQDHADEGMMAEMLMAGTRRMPLASTDTDWLAAVDVLFSKKSRD